MHNAAAPGLGSIGVLVALESRGEPAALLAIGHKIAMHVAASAPLWVSPEDIPADVVAQKRAELTEQARQTGKPPEIVAKMVEGRMRRFYEEVVLTAQPFVLNPEQRVDQALRDAERAAGVAVAIKAFVRFRTGEGIEKRVDMNDLLRGVRRLNRLSAGVVSSGTCASFWTAIRVETRIPIHVAQGERSRIAVPGARTRAKGIQSQPAKGGPPQGISRGALGWLDFWPSPFSWPASASLQTTGRSFSVRRETASTAGRRSRAPGRPPVRKTVWRKQVGQGFAGPVVAGERLILFHRVGGEEIVEALDARTGAPLWRFAYPTAYRDDFGFDEGPRAVPVVANGSVYTFGAEGQLHAIDLATGKKIWSVDTMRRFGVRKGFFGAAGSPLVEDGRVIANIGGKDGARARASSRSTPIPAR